MRPQQRCLCESTYAVQNETNIILLQHPRELRHPFGTVKLLRNILQRHQHHVSWNLTIPDLRKNAAGPVALLYPSDQAVPLDQLRQDERPQSLLVLDGTWHHTKVLLRNNPWLRELRHVCLPVGAPSEYLIRREPAQHCTSTLEAVHRSLKILEPQNLTLDALLTPFQKMVREQSAIPKHRARRPRRKQQRNRPSRALPQRLLEDWQRIVIIYTEVAPYRESGKRFHED
jgi:DTW domain-containing protein YfiP